MQSEERVEKVAKALAMEMYPDTRWPADENDADFGVDDREGRYPLSWHYVQTCRRQAKLAIAALSTDAEPVMFVSEQQLAQCVGHYVPSRKTAEGNFQLALYRAPPAPSVAVKAREALSTLSAQVQDVAETKTFYTTSKNWEKMNFGSFIADEHMGVVLDAADECWANADLKITISAAPAAKLDVP